jgi:hypothetical protein
MNPTYQFRPLGEIVMCQENPHKGVTEDCLSGDRTLPLLPMIQAVPTMHFRPGDFGLDTMRSVMEDQ